MKTKTKKLYLELNYNFEVIGLLNRLTILYQIIEWFSTKSI